jgi:uncharacterized repeat protein (TIGR03943 family)
VVVAVKPAGAAISVLIGSVLLRLSITGEYQRYVRVGMRPWLLISAVALIVIGIVTLLRSLRGNGRTSADASDFHDHDHDHDHEDAHGHTHRGIGVGWLLLAPIAVLLLVAPPTLGSYGLDRSASVDIRAGGRVFDPLPASSQPVPLSLLEFAQRAFDHDGQSMDGVPVQLTGFVAGSESGGFKLARYQIACCAADAAPVVVLVQGVAGAAPERDQWVRVTGTFVPGGSDAPHLTATSVEEIPAPEDPYE